MYELEIHSSVKRYLKDLNTIYFDKITQCLENLRIDPQPVKSKKPKGRLRESFRTKVGDYRIIYSIDHKKQVIRIEKIGLRKDVYKN